MFGIAKYLIERKGSELSWMVFVCLMGWAFAPSATVRVPIPFVIGTVAFVTALGTTAYLVVYLVAKHLFAKSYIRWEFQKVFDVAAPDKHADSHKRSVTQTCVDSKLAYWAAMFDADCARQLKMAGEKVNPDDTTAVKDHLKRYSEAAGWVLSSKGSFWHRHEVARLNGMDTRESFKDYLAPFTVTA